MSETTTSSNASIEATAPERSPSITYAQAMVAVGIMFTVWGILTHWTMSVAGMSLLTTALGLWIREICHDWSEQ